MSLGDFYRVRQRARREGDWIESGLAIRDEMAVVDNKPASENADTKVFSPG